MSFGPKSKDEARVFAQEALRVDVQHLIHKVMKLTGTDEDELARRMGVTRGTVIGFFDSESNLTVRGLAHVLWAMGQEAEITCRAARANPDAPIEVTDEEEAAAEEAYTIERNVHRRTHAESLRAAIAAVDSLRARKAVRK